MALDLMTKLSPIAARCEALLSAYKLKGCDLNDELNPPLTPNELEKETAWFPAVLPEALRQLYYWHNGQPQDAWETRRVLWFRDMQFTSVARAREEYESMMESYGVDNSPEIDGVELLTCFPFASFNGGWYVIPCNGHEYKIGEPLPVVCVLQGIGPHFDSIETMLETCTAWILASTWDGEGWELSSDEERFHWELHNPKRTKMRSN